MKILLCFFVLTLFFYNSILSQDEVSFSQVIENVLEIIENNSIKRDIVDFEKLNAKFSLKKKEISSDSELYNAIQSLIDSLGDGHSYLIMKDGRKFGEIAEPEAIQKVDIESIPGVDKGIKYLQVERISPGDNKKMQKFADDLFNKIISLYQPDMKGWILDFRCNSGGHLWPMLAGLSPLVDSDTAGCGAYPDGIYWRWRAKDGKAGVGSNIHFSVSYPQKINFIKKPVVILTGNKTASSGEASIISFIGKNNVCIIGEKTRGLATINQPFEIGNGIKIMLTTGYFGDRNGNIYPEGIIPDILVPDKGKNSSENILFHKAVKWINESIREKRK